MTSPIQLDFSVGQYRYDVTVEYATYIAHRLKQSSNRRIFAPMQSLPDQLVYLSKEGSRRYVVSIGNIIALDPPLQSVVGHSVHDALWLASVSGGFCQDLCPVESWQEVSPPPEPLPV